MRIQILPAHGAAAVLACMLLSACSGGGGRPAPSPPPPPPPDTTAPDTTISTSPPAVSSSNSASLSFTANETGSTFESRLDGGAFAAATSPQSLSALADGSHTFEVRARDAAGNVDATPASFTWVVDTAAPDTQLVSGPLAIVPVVTATFTFSSPDATATFEASFDNGAFATVTTPYTLNAVAEGSHALRIRARDAAGNIDATPASHAWMVDTTPPETALQSGPAPVITISTATLNATSPDATASFEASLNGAPFAAVTLPLTLTALVDGPHVWRVRARDAAGNLDASPAVAQWTVDTQSPDTSFTAAPTALNNSTSASFTLGSDDAGATFEVSVDGAAFGSVAATFQLSGLSAGQHTVSARARDSQGHVDPTPATHTWNIELTPPVARIQFPLPTSYTHASTVSVRGTAQDASGIAGVSVNGIAATTSTGFSSWVAVVPIQLGENELEVIARDTAGNEANLAATVFNRGPPIVQNRTMDYDPTGDRIVVSDPETKSVYGYRVADGLGHLISNRRPPFTAPTDGDPEDLVVDAANNRALIVDGGLDMLVSVDLTTGLRDSVSSGTVVPGPTRFASAFGLALDAANQRAFVTVRSTDSVIAVDLATGTRTVVSSPTVGTGPALGNPLGIVYDNVSSPGNPRLLVAEATSGAEVILAIDIATGNRVPFSSSAPVGQGVAFESPSTMKLDAAGSRLIVRDSTLLALVGVNLASGDRTIIADTAVGSGPALDLFPAGLAFKPSTGIIYSAQRGGEILAVTPANGNRTLFADSNVGTGVKIYNAGGLIVEQTTGTPTSLLLMEADAQRLTRINLANGNRTVVSGEPGNGLPTVGSGPALNRGLDLVLDRRPAAGGNAVLALLSSPGHELLSVDLTTGNRTLVADLNSVVPAVTQPRNLALDVAGNRVLFTNNDISGSTEAVYSVDLGSGARTTISGNGVGTGTNFGLPSSIVLDPADSPTRALVADGAGVNAIVQVNLATGNRSVAVPGISGLGSGFTLPGSVVHDAANSRLLVVNLGSPQKIIAASLPFVSRTLISGSEIDTTVRGTGPLQHFAPGMAANLADGVLFLVSSDSLAVYAIDMYSGDRVYISR